MAQVPNTKASTEGDGVSDFFNIDTLNHRLQLPNGSTLIQYPDNYATPGLQLTGASVALQQSATSPVIVNGVQINTGVGVARVAPAGNVTGIIMAPGTYNGQVCTVVNEGAGSVTMAASGTSNVADGTGDVIAVNIARLFVWDSVQNLWYRCN